jgi:hypothetical protein
MSLQLGKIEAENCSTFSSNQYNTIEDQNLAHTTPRLAIAVSVWLPHNLLKKGDEERIQKRGEYQETSVPDS